MSNQYSSVPNNGYDEPSFIDQDNLIQPDDIGSQPYSIPNDESSYPNNPTTPQVIKPQIPIDTNSHMFQINFYRRFFHLDSETFFQKIQRASNPLNSSFSTLEEDEQETTELYGFIWITGTLIFLMFVSSTGSNLLSQWLHPDDKAEYEYSFELLTLSISLFYGYNIIAPAALYFGTSFFLKFPERLALTKLISIYGYTNLLWFPITLVNFLIVIFISNKNHSVILNLSEWIIVLLSGAITGLSNISKILPLVRKNALLLRQGDTAAAEKLTYSIISILGVAHLIFTVIVKVSFFGISA